MLKFEGTIVRPEGSALFVVEISDAIETVEGTFYCSVHAPAILEKKTKIFGVDAKQARKLSANFVDDLVGEDLIKDRDGRPIRLSELV